MLTALLQSDYALHWISTMFAVVVLFVFVLRGRIESFRCGSIELKTRNNLRIPHRYSADLEVVHFSLMLEVIVYGQHGVLSDIRYRVRQNGWEHRTDWPQYVEDAIHSHKLRAGRYYDSHAPDGGVMTRHDIDEARKSVEDLSAARYRRLYNTMYRIFEQNHAQARELRNTLYSSATCWGRQGEACLNIPRILDTLKEIEDLEGIGTRELCMNEAERALNEISQWIFEAFLVKYKEKKNGKAG